MGAPWLHMREDIKEKVLSSPNLKRIYDQWGYNPFLFTLICLVWFLWRVGTKPSRINYPCQQIALLQVILFFGSLVAALSGAFTGIFHLFLRKGYFQLVLLCAFVVLSYSGIKLYEDWSYKIFKQKWSRTIPAAAKTNRGPRYNFEKKLLAGALLSSFHSIFAAGYSVDAGYSLVSFEYDPAVTYGNTPPYDRANNPAYDLVWNAVENLKLGTHENPLDDLIDPGNTVVIKPNWLSNLNNEHTKAQAVRPVIDMALIAGATTIYIADGAGGTDTNLVINDSSFSAMTALLQAQNPSITIQNFVTNSTSTGWHWVYLGAGSCFAGSGYADSDMGNSAVTNPASLANYAYYNKADPQGVNPNGTAMGWYAINDKFLNADVIINMPKMKTHSSMIASLSMKNVVGCTINKTAGSATNYRLPHCRYVLPVKTVDSDTYFGNDILWRAVQDVYKILLYGNRSGVLQPTKQRKHLSIVDGIEGLEGRERLGTGTSSGVSVTGTVYKAGCIIAGTDPAAVDVVGSRVMGYDFNDVPNIKNASFDTNYPVGINDPSRIVIVGDELGTALNHVFAFSNMWTAYASPLAVTDFTPPSITNLNLVNDTLTAEVSGETTVYLHYIVNSAEYIRKLTKTSGSNEVFAVLPGSNPSFWLTAQDGSANIAKSSVYSAASFVSAGEGYKVCCYPNPFNPNNNSVTIKYHLSKDTRVTVRIYTITGELIKTLVDETETIGIKTITWDGKNSEGTKVASGIYHILFQTEEYKTTQKIALQK